MLSNVQVVPGATSVARFGDVLVWFETGPEGGGVMLTQLLQAAQAVGGGSVPSRQMGARLAAVLNTGDASAVPALAAATPEDAGLRVVVHGWGSLAGSDPSGGGTSGGGASGGGVVDSVNVRNGWVDQIVPRRPAFFLGRNTVPMAPGSSLSLEHGIVAGDGVTFSLADDSAPAPADEPPPSTPPAPATEQRGPEHTDEASATGQPPVGWPPPAPSLRPQAPPPPGRLVLDDGSTAVLERSCVLGHAPNVSPEVQTGAAVALAVQGPGVAAAHAEIRVEPGRVSVRDLGGAPTYVLAPGSQSWTPLDPGQLVPLVTGTRIALGQRSISYEQP